VKLYGFAEARGAQINMELDALSMVQRTVGGMPPGRGTTQ